MISPVIPRALSIYRRKLWLNIITVFSSGEKLVTPLRCELPASHSTKSHFQATASLETAQRNTSSNRLGPHSEFASSTTIGLN